MNFSRLKQTPGGAEGTTKSIFIIGTELGDYSKMISMTESEKDLTRIDGKSKHVCNFPKGFCTTMIHKR